MTRFLSFFFCMFFFVTAKAQNSYAEAISQGDEAFTKQQYKIAINKYFAAEAFDPTKKDLVKAKVNKAFDAIDALRSNAEKAKKDALASEAKARAALAKSEKFMAAFDFYHGKYALVLARHPKQDERFMFIDKEGNEVFHNRYEKADDFDDQGFAKVQIWEGKFGECCNSLSDYLMDTTGTTYKVLYQLDTLPQYANVYRFGQVKIDSVPWDVEAFDLRKRNPDKLWAMPGLSRVQLLLLRDSIPQIPKQIEKITALKLLFVTNAYLQELPPELWQLTNLQMLNLFGNRLKTLPTEIAHLKNLQTLDLEANSFSNLPKEIGQLKKLTTLNLRNNNFSKAEIEKIKKLLPGCRVIDDRQY